MPRPPHLSLRARLVALVLLAVLPALGFMLYAAHEQLRLSEKRLGERALAIARLAASHQQEVIEGARELLIALAYSPTIRAGAPRECEAYLESLRLQSRWYANLGKIAANGDVECSAVPLPGQTNLADRSYFQEAKQTGELAVGDYVIDRITGRPLLPLAYPLLNERREVTSVVFAALDLGPLNRLAAETQLPPGSTLTMFDRTGKILVRHPDPEAWLGKPLPEAPIIRMLHNNEGATRISAADGGSTLHAYRRIRELESAHLYINVGLPLDALQQQSSAIARRAIAGVAIVAALALVAAWLGGSWFVLRPINAMLDTIGKLKLGDLHARTGLPQKRDELSRLGQALDSTAGALQVRDRELRHAEENYRSIFENAVVGIFRSTPEGRFLTANSALARMFGYASPDELINEVTDIGRQLFAYPERRLELVGRLETESEVIGQEVEYRRRDGGTAWLSLSMRSVRDGSGRVNYYEGVAEDFSERKRAEQSLRQSEERLLNAHRIARLGHWELDISNDRVILSDSVYEIFHVDQSRFGHTFADFLALVHPGDQRRVREALRAAIKGIAPLDYEHRVELPGGKVRHVHQRGEFTFNEKRWAVRATGTVQDVTERKLAEEALNESYQRLQAMSDNAPASVFVKDLEGRYLLVNRRFQAIFNLRREQIIGKTAHELFPCATADRWRANDTYVVERGEAHEFEETLERDGVLHTYIANRFPLFDLNGNVSAVCGIWTDITRRKRAESELTQSREQLRALANRVQTVREEERARISREMHDELGQILTAVKMDQTLLAQSIAAGPPIKTELLKEIARQSKMIDETIKTVRKIATELRPPALDASGLAAALEGYAKEFQNRSGIECRISAPDRALETSPETAIALFRIYQEALTNITRHARATRVDAALRSDDGNVLLDITDNGIGIGAERIANTETLGLLGMRERAAMLGGDVKVAAVPAGGTRVSVRVPMVTRTES